MAAGVMQFALGLNAGGFLGPLGAVAGRLTAVIGGMVSLKAVVDGVMGAISRAGALQDLSEKSRIAVRDLYLLQEGFKAVGRPAEEVDTTVGYLRRSLSDVSESAKTYEQAFAAVGLAMEDVRRMDPTQQINTIGAALRRVDDNTRQGVAMQIFGRGGAQAMLQIAGSAGDFAEAMRRSQGASDVFARIAAASDTLDTTMGFVKSSVGAFFAGIAEGVLPALQAVVDKLNEVDFVQMGNQVGRVINAFINAFKDGKLSMLIGESLKIGLEAAVIMAPAILGKIGIALLKAFETPLIYLQTYYEFIVQQIMEAIGKIPKIGAAAGLKGFESQSFGEILAERKETGAEFFVQGNNLESMNEGVNLFWDQQMATLREKWSAYGAVIDGFQGAADKKVAGKSPGKLQPGMSSEESAKPQATDLEKMGFVFGGRGGSADHARSTSENTRRTADGIDKLLGIMSGQGGYDTGLINA